MLQPSNLQLPLVLLPEGIQGGKKKKAGYSPYTVKVHIKGIQWTRLLHLLIGRKLLNSLTWDVWFSLINSNLLMFWLPGFCCKTLLYPGSSLTSSERFLRTMWEVVFRASILSFVCQTKHNSQLLGHAFLFFSPHWSNKLPWRQTHTARN